MASSLSPECTPLKLKYDACFNTWFEGYLEPLGDASTTTEERKQRLALKAREYDERCGKIWESYQECVQNAVKEKGLTDLLDQARQQEPLVEPPPSPTAPEVSERGQ